jgi:murein DD-endopeptidase MepM/ murein hydrolase activator NlpD
MQNKWFISFLLILTLSGCSQPATPTAVPILVPTETPTQSPSVTPTATPTATAVPLISGVCSPLQAIDLTDLRLITSYQFNFKYPFSEGPDGDKNHPAVDLGFYGFKSFTTDDNHPIQAVLPGKVALVVNNRFPYGNMIMIETPLNSLSPDLIKQMKIGTPYSDDEIKTRSSCQPDQTRISWSSDSKSVYTLYAHMKNPPSLQPGDSVQCGEVVGTIGATGNSSESIEHLHLEIRVGPADAKFGTISAYSAAATEEERYNYCIWALSEVFLPINPSLFWDANQ